MPGSTIRTTTDSASSIPAQRPTCSPSMPCSWPPRSAARGFWSPVPVGGPEPSPSGNVRTRDQLIRTAFMRPHSSGQRPRTGDRQLMNVLSRVRRVNPAFAAAAMVSSMILLAGGLTLAVDLYVSSTGPGAVTGHVSAGQESFTATGNQVGKPTGTAFTGQLSSWYWLDGVDVHSARGASGSVVAFGDSLTDGAYSSYNGNKRWTDDLAARLQALPGSRSVGVLNEGIGGNRVLAFRGDCCG